MSYFCEWTHIKPNPAEKTTFAIELTIVGEIKPCVFNSGVLIGTTYLGKPMGHYCSSTSKPIVIRSPLLITKMWVSYQNIIMKVW